MSNVLLLLDLIPLHMHAISFSERPGELFLIEIEDITDKWTGHIKIGFTLLSPNEILDQCTEEVVYDYILHITGSYKKMMNLIMN